ncbi:AAA ATPase (plasmid) [Deinococcus proteolyticus MRP]|uniref:AAA ATPase n=1 Tax=Deinococcus proteolyticus (strain ATCC 35074 / DSM 20540 / JCM 6276 / NBRC 101906 / NCIMB 13154 / VKM Ac-1939 / CCM 2703 / MRP) TaxID=693977 RepID=F0RQR8_DEIPM|nr:ATPase AAA [Deinococcus proteolyticus]ADY27627.1 AAA ATPase [Deinococcus proteolyticus MRP]
MSMIRDITTPEEYQAILERLTDDIGKIVGPNLTDVDEIIMDRGQPLALRLSDLRVTYPYLLKNNEFDRIDQHMQSGVAGGWRKDGRIGIPGTLHRLSREVNTAGITTKLTVRVGRALIGVAEPLRPVIVRAVQENSGIAIVGPPAVGKTTLLRDIARIMAERLAQGLVIIDTSNEIAGDSDIPHRIIGKARVVAVGNPLHQGEKFARVIGNMGPQALLSDEIGYRDDIPIIRQNAPRGVSITATLHGKNMVRVVNSENLWPLLGVIGRQKVEPSVFAQAIEVIGRGRYRVHEDFDASIEAILAGKNAEKGVSEIAA